MTSTLQRRRLLKVAAAGVAGAAAPAFLQLLPGQAAAATPFPARPVRLVVPFPPGGGTDALARSLADGLARELGQSVIVDNKPGAGTVIGSDAVAKSPPDGHTLLLSTSALPINTTLARKLPYASNAFAEVSLVARGPLILVTHPDKPYRTMNDVLAAARANPGKLVYGSSGSGTAVHLAGELLKNLAKVDLTHVPYRGASPSFNDLLGGRIDFLFGSPGGVASFLENGRVRPIAVTSAARSSVHKDVPTIGETVPGYVAELWYALFAPAGTPPEVIAAINAAVKRAAEAPDFKSRTGAEGLAVALSTPQELTRFVKEEEARWRKVIIEGGVTSD